MKNYFIEKELAFNPKTLKSYWAKPYTDISGDYIFAFAGSLESALDDKKNAFAFHFVIEHFGKTESDLFLIKRIFMMILQQELGQGVTRLHDDLFYMNTPISISRYKVTRKSIVLYVGILLENIITIQMMIGAQEIEIPIRPLALSIIQRYTSEMDTIFK